MGDATDGPVPSRVARRPSLTLPVRFLLTEAAPRCLSRPESFLSSYKGKLNLEFGGERLTYSDTSFSLWEVDERDTIQISDLRIGPPRGLGLLFEARLNALRSNTCQEAQAMAIDQTVHLLLVAQKPPTHLYNWVEQGLPELVEGLERILLAKPAPMTDLYLFLRGDVNVEMWPLIPEINTSKQPLLFGLLRHDLQWCPHHQWHPQTNTATT